MSEYLYECRYCGKQWGGVYRVHDPVCSKCGSEGDYYVITRKVERSDIFGYEVEEQKLGEKVFGTSKTGRPGGPDTSD